LTQDIARNIINKHVTPSFVFDTDVVVAALRSDQGASRLLLMAALFRQCELLLSVPLILEYEAVLTRPHHLSACGLSSTEVGSILDDLASVAKRVNLAFRWRPRLSDPDDDMVLETAMNGGADAIVTFNQRDYATGVQGLNCDIIAPKTALRQIRSMHQ
jgi:putative PIN family toxin of toxin-antitoxin system